MTAAPSYLTPDQVGTLLRGIKPSRVLHLDGMSHLAAYDVRAHLNRVFGFGRWSADVLDVTPLYEQETETKNKKPAYRVAYRATVRLTVCAPDGSVLATYTECAVGDSTMPDFKRGDCHDMAIKTAESQALKRCATNLGDQFGLSLYRNGSTDPVVTVTLVGALEPEKKDGDAGGAKRPVDEQVPDVVPEEHPTPDTQPDHQQAGTPPTVAELLLDAQHASSGDALSSLARRAVAVHAAGHLTDAELATIKDAVTARRAALTAPAAETTPATDDATLLAQVQAELFTAAKAAGLTNVRAQKVLHEQTGKALAEASVEELRMAIGAIQSKSKEGTAA